jgi:hypothetical protein
MRPEISLLVELLARSVYERWKAGQPVPGAPSPAPQKQHDLVFEAPNVADRPRGARPMVHLGADWCKTLQVVAGGCFELYSTYPIRVRVVLASSVAK